MLPFWHGNTFRIDWPFWGKSSCHQWIPPQAKNIKGALMLYFIIDRTSWTHHRIVINLRYSCVFTVMSVKHTKYHKHIDEHPTTHSFGQITRSVSILDTITQTQDIFSLVDIAWKHPKYPCFCILPLEYEVNTDLHKHEYSEVIYSNRNKSPKGMSGNSRLQKHGKHVHRFHLTKYTG